MKISLKEKLIELFFPKKYTCFCCDREIPENTKICSKCLEELKIIESEESCIKCGNKVSGDSSVCDKCKNIERDIDRNYGVFQYKDLVKNIIYKYKFKKAYYITEEIVDYYLLKFNDIKEEIDFITYVPKTKKEMKRAKKNCSYQLAEEFSKRTKIPLFLDIEKIKESKEQKKLKYKERQENLKGCFKCKKSIKDKNILIIDDVFTTGATVSSVAKALKRRGAKRVISLTFAVD